MILPANAGYMAIEHGSSSGGSMRTNIIGFTRTDFTGTVLDAALAVRDAFNDHLSLLVPQGWSISRIRVKFGPQATGPEAEVTSGFDNGAWAGSFTSPQNALLIRKITNTGGAAGRGRIFWPWVAEDAVNQEGLLTQEQQVGITTKFEAFRTAMAAADLPLAVLGESGEGSPSIIVALSCQQKIATQRRRNRR